MAKQPSKERVTEMYALLEKDIGLSDFVTSKVAAVFDIRRDEGILKVDVLRLVQGSHELVEIVAEQEAGKGEKFSDREVLSRIKTAAVELEKCKHESSRNLM